MNLFVCKHPKRIVNPYTGEEMMVPCGKCSICRTTRQAHWVERLDVEMASHPYTLFVTLTYNEAAVPRLFRDYDRQCLVDPVRGLLVNFDEIGYFEDDKCRDYIDKRSSFPYSDVSDLQKFIHRLRSKVRYNEREAKNSRIRYYGVLEYGPTTFRPHFHVLIFFESKWLADNATSCIPECWSDDFRSKRPVSKGITDVQFVSDGTSCGSYVASYVNGFSDLPLLYQHRALRPLAVFSKHPAIGTLLCGSEEVRSLFSAGTVTQRVFRRKTNEFADVPLSKSLENRLYPKIKGFGELPFDVCCRVYESINRFFGDSWQDFRWWCDICDFRGDTEVANYYRVILNSETAESALRRLYSVLVRVSLQARDYGISIKEYVRRIVKYYNDKDAYNLKQQLLYEQEYVRDYSSRDLICLDPLFVDRVQHGCLTYRQKLTLKSFGYDEYSLSLLDEYDYGNLPAYRIIVSKCDKIYNDSLKNKAKKEYIETHSNNQLIKQLYG